VYRAIREGRPELSRFLRDSRIPETSFRSSRRVKGVSTREILTPTVRVGDIPLRGGYGVPLASRSKHRVTGYGKFLGALIFISSQDISRWHPRVVASFPEEKRYIYIYAHTHIYRKHVVSVIDAARCGASNKTRYK